MAAAWGVGRVLTTSRTVAPFRQWLKLGACSHPLRAFSSLHVLFSLVCVSRAPKVHRTQSPCCPGQATCRPSRSHRFSARLGREIDPMLFRALGQRKTAKLIVGHFPPAESV